MTKQESLEKACQILRKRVRYADAGLSLYVETWIVPLIDCIESDDFTLIREYYEYEQGHKMKSSNDAKVSHSAERKNICQKHHAPT